MFAHDFILTSFEPLNSSDDALSELFLLVNLSKHKINIFANNTEIWLTKNQLNIFLAENNIALLFDALSIGKDSQHHYCVVMVDSINENHTWKSLRDILDIVSPASFAPIARGALLARWKSEHQFCGRCGKPTGADQIDNALVCSPCGLRYYPRISPCMIVIVRRGNQILLAHHLRSKKITYSPLAGFVEAGETAEEAVKREVFEEVGITVSNIHYVSSQSWPFPGQLMLGFYADYESGELLWDKSEIVHAAWFDVEHLPSIPSNVSIAGQLITGCLNHQP